MSKQMNMSSVRLTAKTMTLLSMTKDMATKTTEARFGKSTRTMSMAPRRKRGNST